ncbi:hypothetical protein AAC387_Pa08g0930 [Persea americana]
MTAVVGVPKIQCNYNPAAWVLEVSSMSVEKQLGIDFSQVYRASSLYRDLNIMVEQLSKPSPSSKRLHFASRISAKPRSRTCSTSQAFYILQGKRFIRMYSSHVYSLAQVAIEVPYINIQAVICGMITYLAIGFYLLVYKLLCKFGGGGYCVIEFAQLPGLYMRCLQIHMGVFLKDYFSFQHGELLLVAAILVALPLLFASLSVISTTKVNLPKR